MIHMWTFFLCTYLLNKNVIINAIFSYYWRDCSVKLLLPFYVRFFLSGAFGGGSLVEWRRQRRATVSIPGGLKSVSHFVSPACRPALIPHLIRRPCSLWVTLHPHITIFQEMFVSKSLRRSVSSRWQPVVSIRAPLVSQSPVCIIIMIICWQTNASVWIRTGKNRVISPHWLLRAVPSHWENGT